MPYNRVVSLEVMSWPIVQNISLIGVANLSAKTQANQLGQH
jgi:hypothetical protein